jgi:hypothetical protein
MRSEIALRVIPPLAVASASVHTGPVSTRPELDRKIHRCALHVTDRQYQARHDKERNIKMRMPTLSGSIAFAVVLSICGCKGSEAPKTPLGEATPMTSISADHPAVTGLTGDAKLALDSGNALFRAKAYDQALSQYSRSADLAPNELAPLLGIMMVADAKNDAKLAGATLPRIRKIDPSMADSSTVTSHSKMMKAHPRGAGAPTT